MSLGSSAGTHVRYLPTMLPTKPFRFPARLSAVLASVVLFASSAFAQPAATGVIEGRVLNVTSGDYLNNARVVIEGSSTDAFTDRFGHYILAGVPAGQVTLRVSYTGLTPRLENVT